MRANDHPDRERASRSEADDLIARRTMSARPMLVLNPSHDRVFGGIAETLLDRHGPYLEALQRSLRQTYPNAVVRARDLSGEAVVAWYVFREGHWIDGGPHSKD